MKLKMLSLAVLLAVTPAALLAEISAEKKIEIQKMLEISGAKTLIDQTIVQIIDHYRQNTVGVRQEVWDRFLARIKAGEMIDLMIPVYDKYFTLEDLRAINAFYVSPVGRRMVNNTPQVMEECTEICRQWAFDLGRVAREEMRAANSPKESKQPLVPTPASVTPPAVQPNGPAALPKTCRFCLAALPLCISLGALSSWAFGNSLTRQAALATGIIFRKCAQN